MNNQFKNPLSWKETPAPQPGTSLAGGERPVAPGDQAQQNGGAAGALPAQGELLSRHGAADAAGKPPLPLADQVTLKNLGHYTDASTAGSTVPGALPLTPDDALQSRVNERRVLNRQVPVLSQGPGQSLAFRPQPATPEPHPAAGPWSSGAAPQMYSGPQGQSASRPLPGQGLPPGPGQAFPQSNIPQGRPGTGQLPPPNYGGGPAPYHAPGQPLAQRAAYPAPQPRPDGPAQMVLPGPAGVAPGSLARPSAPLVRDGFQHRQWSEGQPGQKGQAKHRPERPGRRERRRRQVPIWARVLLTLLVLLLLLGTGGFLYYQVNFAGSVNTIVGQTVQRAHNEQDPNGHLTNGILTGPRVNILLLGSDTDQKFQGNFIAQTDIVVTINPSTSSVGMLSIPRDFYLPVPGYGMHKLDEAYGLGGVALSRQTIEEDFGIPINYYAWVGLDGFIKVIDEVGGVDVDVLHPIMDDNYPDDVGKNANNPYALKRLMLSPGPQHLDGPTALEYVRSRHADLVGDFGRSVRQQQVLSALKTRLANPDIFSKLSSIAQDLTGYLKTDMQLTDVLKLMNFARSLDPAKIQKLTLGPPYSTSGVAPQGTADAGADVVFPNCAALVPAIQQMLDLGSSAACNVTGDSASLPGQLPLAYSTGHPGASTLAASQAADLSGVASLLGNSASGLMGRPTNLFGIQSLLDLVLMGTFESTSVF